MDDEEEEGEEEKKTKKKRKALFIQFSSFTPSLSSILEQEEEN